MAQKCPPPATKHSIIKHGSNLKISSTVTATALLALVAIPGTSQSQAAEDDTGTVTSIPLTIGKAQGSDRWGVIGDVRTREDGSRPTYTYGVGVNPVTGSLLVTDSAKVIFGMQRGTPSISNYPLVSETTIAQTGQDDRNYTEYAGQGQYTVDGKADATRTRNTGIGKRYADYTNRSTIDLPTTYTPTGGANGPRGIGFTSDGTAYIVNHDKQTLATEAPNKLLRYDTNMNPLTPLLRSGSLNNPNHSWGSYSAAVNSANEILVDSFTGASVIRFNQDGTQLASFPLWPDRSVTHAPYPYDAKALYRADHVSVDKTDDSFYLATSRFRYHTDVQPYLEKHDKNNNLTARFTSPYLTKGMGIRGSAVDQKTGQVFAWTDIGHIVSWSHEGTQQETFFPGEEAGRYPGLSLVRSIDFDTNGRMYITVMEGSTETRVMILGHTPAPVTQLAATRSIDKTKVSFKIENPSITSDGKAHYKETQILDFLIEETHDGGTTWQPIAKDGGTSPNLAATVSGLDPNLDYSFRVSAWNEAGNGDWRETHPTQETAATPETTPTPAPTDTSANTGTRTGTETRTTTEATTSATTSIKTLSDTGTANLTPLFALAALTATIGLGALTLRRRKTLI